VNLGDRLVVFPHEICPVDGAVVEGRGTMDEAYLTGEPFQIAKVPGAEVLSGAVNGESAVTVEVTHLPVDSRYSKIMKVMQEAEANRPRFRRIGDRLGAWYTVLAVAVAAAGWIIGHDASRFLAVLVIATPCPLLLAIPVAIIGAISMAAGRAIIVKNPAMLERIDSCRTVIFDKTGTLTFGQPEVIEVIPADGIGKQAVLETAALAEQRSEHPLAKAVVRKAVEQSIALKEAGEFSYKPGKGITSIVDGAPIAVGNRLLMHELGIQIPDRNHDEGATEVLVARRGSFLGTILIADNLRTEAVTAVQDLKRMGLRILLLTGDAKAVAESVAKALGVSGVYSELLPEQKLAKVAELIDVDERRGRGVRRQDQWMHRTGIARPHLGRKARVWFAPQWAVAADSMRSRRRSTENDR